MKFAILSVKNHFLLRPTINKLHKNNIKNFDLIFDSKILKPKQINLLKKTYKKVTFFLITYATKKFIK